MSPDAALRTVSGQKTSVGWTTAAADFYVEDDQPPRVGDRVFFGLVGNMGTHSSRLAVRPRQCYRIPEGISYDSAAGGEMPAATALRERVPALRALGCKLVRLAASQTRGEAS